jgi:predicted ATPase
MVLEYLIDRPPIQQLIYIEEPEAHLFPAAQNKLVEYLSSLLSENNNIRLIITTHSPYVLAKINNLLKAGSLAESLPKEFEAKIARIVSQASWLKPKNVRAYAVIEKRLDRILEDDGLIDAAYLDDVSGAVAEEFSALLEIEFSQ